MPKIPSTLPTPVPYSAKPAAKNVESAPRTKPKDDKRTSSNKQRLSALAVQAGLKWPQHTQNNEESVILRSDRRQRLNAVRKQHNLETIVAKAESFCNDAVAHQHVDLDWYYTFLELAESINTRPMQQLWAKILAGEVSRPGTFSIKTLFTLKKMTQKEAEMFQAACALMSRNYKYSFGHLIMGFSRKPSIFSLLRPKHELLSLSKFGLPYGDILTLVDIGLILAGELESGEWSNEDYIEQYNNGHKFELKAKESGLVLSYHRFSDIGLELSRLIGDQDNPQYYRALTDTLAKGFDIRD